MLRVLDSRIYAHVIRETHDQRADRSLSRLVSEIAPSVSALFLDPFAMASFSSVPVLDWRLTELGHRDQFILQLRHAASIGFLYLQNPPIDVVCCLRSNSVQ